MAIDTTTSAVGDLPPTGPRATSPTARSRHSLQKGAALSLLTGLLLPVYLLDDSIALKGWLSPAIAGACLAWLLTSRFDVRSSGAYFHLALLTFLSAYAVSVTASAVLYGISLNAAYPFLMIALALRVPDNIKPFVTGLFFSLLAVTGLGWYRFITGEGGMLDEHALGYWGIKYTEATRNNDALVPILVSAMAMAAMQRIPAHGSRAMRALLWIALLVGLPALILTFARSAWITVLAFLVLQSGSNWRVLVRFALALTVRGGALLVLVALVMPELFEQVVDIVALLERLQSIYDPDIASSNRDRTGLLTYGVLLGVEHVWLGVGAGQFSCCFASLGFNDLLGALHPENLILHLFSEFGALPALSAVAVIGIAAVRGFRSHQADGYLAAASLTALMVFLQMNSELPSLFVWMLLGVCVGTAAKGMRPDDQS